MKRGHVPIRTCMACRRKVPKTELQRYVVEQRQLTDGAQGLGYGVYCCRDELCRARLSKKFRKKSDSIRNEDGSN